MSRPTRHDCVGALLVRDGEVLLGLRAADRDWLPGVRDLFGGHIVAGEMAEDALRHESREELGIDPLVFRAAGVLESEAGAWRLQVFIVDSWKGGLASGSRTSTLRCAGPRRRKRGRCWRLPTLASARSSPRSSMARRPRRPGSRAVALQSRNQAMTVAAAAQRTASGLTRRARAGDPRASRAAGRVN